MSEIAIQVENLAKQYLIGEQRERYKTLRDKLASTVAKPYRALRSLVSRNGRSASPGKRIFWALKEVSFEIKTGEVVGVIGRNGAGKSTLLKILSRITEPTEGSVTIEGRVGSLLEVGTGFHAELSGRDNIYLNGAILGMRRVEIDRRFDEIVAFAEVEKFLDTPVKHYSSGMHMRLAFSVAAHLEPEVLLVDEVLAVGDTSFQKKCLGKMGEVARQGRTVLFVSHNMAAVSQLTQRSLVLSGGGLRFAGETDQAIGYYLQDVDDEATTLYQAGKHGRRLDGYSRAIEFVNFELRDQKNKMLAADGDLVVFITVKAREQVSGFRLSITISKSDGTPVGSAFGSESLSIEREESATFEFRMKKLRLAPGHYHCGFGIGKGPADFAFDVVLDVVNFEVLSPEEGAVSTWHPVWGSIRFASPECEKVTVTTAV